MSFLSLKSSSDCKNTIYQNKLEAIRSGRRWMSGGEQRSSRSPEGPNVLLHCHLEEEKALETRYCGLYEPSCKDAQGWLNVFLTDLGILR